jgi:hypothetical protein
MLVMLGDMIDDMQITSKNHETFCSDTTNEYEHF